MLVKVLYAAHKYIHRLFTKIQWALATAVHWQVRDKEAELMSSAIKDLTHCILDNLREDK